MFKIPVDLLLDPGSYGIRLLETDRVRQLEISLLDKPPTDNMILTGLIDPESGDVDDFSADTVLSYKFLILAGNHRRAALQNIKKTGNSENSQHFNSVFVDVYKGEL